MFQGSRVFKEELRSGCVGYKRPGLWREEKNNDMTWLNPCDERNWKYIVDIAKEAVKLGFDEIQFDYVRFPDETRSRMDFGETDF